MGHARVFLFYDLVARFLRSAGASVVFVMNITDIKINEGVTDADFK